MSGVGEWQSITKVTKMIDAGVEVQRDRQVGEDETSTVRRHMGALDVGYVKILQSMRMTQEC